MVRAAFAIAVIVGGCLAVAGCVTTQVGNQGAGKTIRYEVTGDSGTANNVTYMINHGEQQETNVTLPWSKEFTADGKFQAFVVNAQNAAAGSISCKITVDGQVINQQTSNGQYAVVMCSGP
jgi:hypothetical protein